MPKLDIRLQTVAKQIKADVHVDIGSDHGQLLVALLDSGRIRHGIAIENKQQPFLNSRAALAGLDCDVRLGDGMAALTQGEADSLSICGMGGQTIVAILCKEPDRIPNRIVLQPNRKSDLVRRWAFDHKFRLSEETIVRGHWPYDVLTFRRSAMTSDPAYIGIDRELGFAFGPLNLKRNDPMFQDQLGREREYLRNLNRLHPESRKRLEMIETALQGSTATNPT